MTAKEKDKDNLYVRLIYVQDGESVINRRAGRGVPVFLCELASTEDFDCMQPAPEPIYCYEPMRWRVRGESDVDSKCDAPGRVLSKRCC